MWREWGWNGMVKYDNCYIPYDNIVSLLAKVTAARY